MQHKRKMHPAVGWILAIATVIVASFSVLVAARIIEYQSELGSLLFTAAREGDNTVVRILLMAGFDPNAAEPPIGLPPLFGALEGGHPDTAMLLLRHGANPVFADAFATPPLTRAVRLGDQRLVDAMLQSGATFSLPDLILRGDAEAVRTALETDPTLANWPSWPDDGIKHTLQFAIEARDAETVRLLLDHGADPNAPGVRDFAQIAGIAEIVTLLESQPSKPQTTSQR